MADEALRARRTFTHGWGRVATAVLVAGAMVASMLAVPPTPARAEPSDTPDRRPPLGARTSTPAQQFGDAAVRDHLATAEETAAVGTGAVEDLEPPEVPGAVGQETVYPDVTLPSTSAVDQEAAFAVEEVPVTGFSEDESVELRSMRQPTSQVFQNPDGTRTLRVYDEVAFVRDPQLQALADQGMALGHGEILQSVDPTLATRPDGRVAPVRALLPREIQYPMLCAL